MNVVPFIADSAADAVAQIRARLGPQAVVVNVRQIEPAGLSRFWQKPRLEVLACLPDPPVSEQGNGKSQGPPALAPEQVLPSPPAPVPDILCPGEDKTDFSSVSQNREYGGWKSGALLESMGLLPFYAQKVVERLQKLHSPQPPDSIGEQYHLVCSALRQMWPAHPSPQIDTASCHVIVGPPGVGKTTFLCKWLAQLVLMDNLTPRVWRLDGSTANTAECLGVYCDILGIPMERAPVSLSAGDSPVLVDLPGVTLCTPREIQEYKDRLQALPQPVVHLVLNAAYEVPLLLAQIRSFSVLPIADVSFCHLDEERRWGKLWNIVLGTNYSMGFLSAGQNIPGDFFLASADRLLSQK